MFFWYPIHVEHTVKNGNSINVAVIDDILQND